MSYAKVGVEVKAKLASIQSHRVCPACGLSSSSRDAKTERCPVDGSPTIVVSPDKVIGQVVCQNYLVLELIGVGAWSEVYKARHEYSGELAAVKILHTHLANDPLKVARFAREALLLIEFEHPNFARVFDHGEIGEGRPCIVMEFLSGLSLDGYLSKIGKLSLKQSLELFLPVCEALSRAHGRGLIHRDLKPSNIFLVERKGLLIPKILDFGLAKMDMLDSGGALASLTQSGEILGTPAYMSPEQCLGNLLDARSDLYSLGCVIYEALTNKRAISGKTAFEAMSNQIGRPPESFASVCPQAQIPGDVEAVIFKLLEKEPDDRFATAKEFSLAYTRALKSTNAAAGAASSSLISKRSAASLTILRELPEAKPSNTTKFEQRVSNSPAEKSKTADIRRSRTNIIVMVVLAVCAVNLIFMAGNQRWFNKKAINNRLQNAVSENDSIPLHDFQNRSITAQKIAEDRIVAVEPKVTEEAMSEEANALKERQIATADYFVSQRLFNEPQMKSLCLRGMHLSHKILQKLSAAKSLEILDIGECEGIDAESFFPLRGLKNFMTIISDGTHLDRDTMKGMAGLHINKLTLGNAKVGDDSCEVLGTMATLTILNLDRDPVTPAGIKLLKNLQLKVLLIAGCPIDKDIGLLNNFKALHYLSLRSTDVTDHGLSQLLLPKLEKINLSDTKITDSGLIDCAMRPNLKNIEAKRCPMVTAEGVQNAIDKAAAAGRKINIVICDQDLNKRVDTTMNLMESIY